MTATVWERVKTALTALGLPMAANEYIAATSAERPDLYLVYFLVTSPPEQFMDDRESLRSNRIQVSIYSRNGLISLPNVSGAMVAAGFAPGPKNEIPYNHATRHFGLSLEFVELEES